jgi:hypothetical protein
LVITLLCEIAAAEENVLAGYGVHWRRAGDCDGGGEYELMQVIDPFCHPERRLLPRRTYAVCRCRQNA